MDPAAGLCTVCKFQRVVPTTRQTEYLMCTKHKDDPEIFPRYPRLPVRLCIGFEPIPKERPGGGW